MLVLLLERNSTKGYHMKVYILILSGLFLTSCTPLIHQDVRPRPPIARPVSPPFDHEHYFEFALAFEFAVAIDLEQTIAVSGPIKPIGSILVLR